MYDAFISYRRGGGGFYRAQVVYGRLQERGINCFFDLEELNSGRFDSKLIDSIRASKNFLLILQKGSLDRCANPDDWVRQEIEAAVEADCQIIPILFDDFEWPRDPGDLPEDIWNLRYVNGVPATTEYLSAMIDKIISYMRLSGNGPGGAREESLPSVTKELRIATSNLTVIDSIMQGWDSKVLFRRYGCSVKKRPYKWSDRILKDLYNGKLDIAIYNKESCLSFNETHGNAIRIVRDVCSSMGGRIFIFSPPRTDSGRR